VTPIQKVLGTETEFGITIRNEPEFNPVLASSLVVNSYAGSRARIQWSYEEETPGKDARGFGHQPAPTVDLDTTLVNVVLGNGARLYVDHAHPEYSTPECFDALEGALYDKAGEVVLARAVEAAQATFRSGQRLYIHKNNSDGKGNSYGAHENYLLSRKLPFSDVIAHMTPFFVSRQVFTGSGKVGAENGRPNVPFQLSQRADFFEEEVGLETTLKRPIVNTRDEPHADPGRYRRLHVIIGDANLSEEQTFLKLGATALVLAALEAGALPEPVRLAHPVDAVWQVSHDASLRRAVDLADGGSASALEIQWRYFEWASRFADGAGVGPVEQRVVRLWKEVLETLERDPLEAADRLDWAAKLGLLLSFQERDGLGWDDPKMRLIDLQYHDVDPDRGLYHRLVRSGRMRRLFSDEQITTAVAAPPERTRAYFRGRCVDQFPSSIVAANWDSLVFDIGEAVLKRVPMMEPLRGGRDLVAPLLDGAPTAADLVKALGGDHGRAGTETDSS
jgi:proteasome accessory factor PafA2